MRLEGYIPYESIYMTFWKTQRDRAGGRSVVARGNKAADGLTTKGDSKRILLEGNETAPHLGCGSGYMTTCIYQISETCSLKRVTFVVRELKFT